MMRYIWLSTLALLAIFLWPCNTTAQQPDDVSHTRVVIPGYAEPNTPGAKDISVAPELVAAITDPDAFDSEGRLDLNKAIYVRFFSPQRTNPPEAIVILIPELEAGAASLRILAKEIVRLSEGRYEVWAVDHRSNLLEDLGPMVEAENARTTAASLRALGRYMSHPAGRGGALASKPALASSFVSEWGLDLYLRDIRAIVDAARAASSAIFMGGQSQGATIAQMFAGYDFGDVAGYRLLKGLLLLQGSARPEESLPLPAEAYLDGGEGVIGLNQLRAGAISPFQTEPNGSARAATFQIIEISAQLTLVDPEGTLLQRFLPQFLPFPATNAAFMGLLLDDEFQPTSVARVSIGFLKAPAGGTIQDVARRIGDDPNGHNPNGLWAPKDPGPGNVLEWEARKDLSSLGPEFVAGREVSTTQALMENALMIAAAEGEVVTARDANSNQWFFPVRLRTDMRLVGDLGRGPLPEQVLAAQRSRGGNAISLTMNSRVKLPILAISAGEGGADEMKTAYKQYQSSTRTKRKKLSLKTMPSYTHADLLTSLEKTSGNAGKNAPELIIAFIEKQN
jgi:pimeloyl-ACP methyl ester carboxylesterase